jgi:hypothetical protein
MCSPAGGAGRPRTRRPRRRAAPPCRRSTRLSGRYFRESLRSLQWGRRQRRRASCTPTGRHCTSTCCTRRSRRPRLCIAEAGRIDPCRPTVLPRSCSCCSRRTSSRRPCIGRAGTPSWCSPIAHPRTSRCCSRRRRAAYRPPCKAAVAGTLGSCRPTDLRCTSTCCSRHSWPRRLGTRRTPSACRPTCRLPYTGRYCTPRCGKRRACTVLVPVSLHPRPCTRAPCSSTYRSRTCKCCSRPRPWLLARSDCTRRQDAHPRPRCPLRSCPRTTRQAWQRQPRERRRVGLGAGGSLTWFLPLRGVVQPACQPGEAPNAGEQTSILAPLAQPRAPTSRQRAS